MLPMLVALRGRVGCKEPRPCELSGSMAAIYEVGPGGVVAKPPPIAAPRAPHLGTPPWPAQCT